MLSIKNVKISKSQSQGSLAFTSTVYWNGQLVGDARNDGNGGCSIVHLYLINGRGKAKKVIPITTDLRDEINAFIKALPEVEYLHDHIDELAFHHGNVQDCKKKTIFRSNDKCDWFELNNKFSPEVKAHLIKKYGPDVEILNETIAK
jgi:hypothetical protein